MMWRDFLYFSKGERRALTLLVCLITIAFILLLWTDHHPENHPEVTTSPSTDTIRGKAQKAAQLHPTTKPQPKETHRQKEDIFAVKNPKRSLSSYTSYPKTEKYPAGTVVELNTADSLTLKKVPGIGSAFSRRIVRYRELLGGFYTVSQLGEVYGIDAERYETLKGWFVVDTMHIRRLPVNTLPADTLAKHPYISYQQARTIYNLRSRKGKLTGWTALSLLEEFTEEDRIRITPYLSFE